MDKKIRSFTDLNAWKEGHSLVLNIYDIVDKFPKKEQYLIASQMLRASISVTSNIAEGFGRRNFKEKIQFYYIAQSSFTELQNQLIIGRDRKYLHEDGFTDVWKQTVIIRKFLGGLIKSIKQKNN